ncbi:MAG: cytochrome c oxidase subunit I [Proteobacteria bacterium]|nr:cytochrome c oxidase subunit I [Pseudomonadota bacterium]
MTTADQAGPAPADQALAATAAGAAPANYLTAQRGLLSWLFTLDHKRIGVMYLISVLTFFFIGGLLAVVLRLELMSAKPDLLSADTYNKLFTLHGAIMIFVFIIPSIPASLGNIFLPIMIGAKDVAFPRLNLLSYWIYLVGSVFLLYSILAGAMDTGWTFYTPYSTQTGTAVISATLGVFVLGFSSILTGINFIVTIHKLRAPGLTWMRLPLFLWATYATAIIQVLATPVLAITLLLLLAERVLGIGIFDPAMGGDPVLYQHFFWFYSHPAVYIMILPAFGIISEIIAVHSQKPIFGYRAIAYSSLAIALLSFLVWGHHMFVSGQSELAGMIFSFLTFTVAVPTAIKVFSWVATLYKGSIALTTAMLYALVFLFTFTIGGLTGIFLGSLTPDIHLHDTYFVVAHFHYVMMGGTVIAFLGGLHHWWPKFTGRMFSERWGRVGAALVFVGFNGTFFPKFLLGAQGMPRRYHSYDLVAPDQLPLFELLHRLSSFGSQLLTLGFLIMAGYLLHSLFYGQRAPANPWGGATLEWQTASPPPTSNFDDDPVCSRGPYDFRDDSQTATAAAS